MFPMPDATHAFEERAGWLVERYMALYALKDFQAAALPGNFGAESEEFKTLQERAPVSGRGGRGWPQWTGSRRVAYEAWSKRFAIDPDSDEADFGYTVVELSGDYSGTIAALLKTGNIQEATWSVGQTYERPGGTTSANLPGFERRLVDAHRALAGYRGLKTPATLLPPAANGPLQTLDVLAATFRAFQTTLKVAEYYTGAVDGKPRSVVDAMEVYAKYLDSGMN